MRHFQVIPMKSVKAHEDINHAYSHIKKDIYSLNLSSAQNVMQQNKFVKCQEASLNFLFHEKLYYVLEFHKRLVCSVPR